MINPEPDTLWRPVRGKSISSWVMQQILDSLDEGRLRPGQFLGTERDLCTEFEVTRLPMRDAIKQLQAIGVLEVRPGSGGGIRVAETDPDHFADLISIQFSLIGVTAEEIFNTRIALQPQAVELAAINATEEDIEEIGKLIEGAHRLVKDGVDDFSVMADQFLKTHFAMVEASKNKALIALMRGLLRILYSTYLRSGRMDRAQIGIRGLTRILEQIKARNPEKARRVTREHLITQRDDWLMRMRESKAS